MLTRNEPTIGTLRRPAAVFLLIASVLLALAVGTTGADAKTIKVPKGKKTIQAAVNAANPGDLILVSPKKRAYFENVTIADNNIRITGVPRKGKLPVVDGTSIDGLLDDQVFDITGNRVTISKIEARHGNGIDCFADQCSFKRVVVRMSDNGGDCIEITGVKGRVEASNLRGCDEEAIDIDGPNARIFSNTIRGGDAGCVNVTGDNAIISKNRVANCEDDEGFYIDGDKATLKKNSVRNTDDNGFYVIGARAYLSGNRATNIDDDCFDLDEANRSRLIGNKATACDGGFEVDGENFIVKNNVGRYVGDDDGFELTCTDQAGGETGNEICRDVEISRTRASDNNNDDEGFDISMNGDGAVISRNVSRENNDGGFEINADHARIIGNRSLLDGSEANEPGFDISGDDNLIEGNSSVASGEHGIEIDGDDLTIRKNTARLSNKDGIFFSSGIGSRLIANSAFANAGDGINVDGTNTVLKRNVSSGNRRDCANDGTIATKQKNRCADGSNFTKPGTISRVKASS